MTLILDRFKPVSMHGLSTLAIVLRVRQGGWIKYGSALDLANYPNLDFFAALWVDLDLRIFSRVACRTCIVLYGYSFTPANESLGRTPQQSAETVQSRSKTAQESTMQVCASIKNFSVTRAYTYMGM